MLTTLFPIAFICKDYLWCNAQTTKTKNVVKIANLLTTAHQVSTPHPCLPPQELRKFYGRQIWLRYLESTPSPRIRPSRGELRNFGGLPMENFNIAETSLYTGRLPSSFSFSYKQQSQYINNNGSVTLLYPLTFNGSHL